MATTTTEARTLLETCVYRAVAAAARETIPGEPRRATRWETAKVIGRASMRASHVASFIVEWALAVRELGQGQPHAAIERWSSDSSATWYRRLVAFRELFPEYDDPEPIALEINRAVDGKLNRAQRAGQLEVALP
jgi:hypothetical protein